MPSDDLPLACQTAAELLALAVLQLFPGARLCQGEGSSGLFFYDFLLPKDCQSDFLPHVEERMRLLFRQELSIDRLEMTPQNAAALLKHHRQWILAERVVAEGEGLVQMIRVEDLVDWCEAPLQLQWEKAPLFKLINCIPLEIDGLLLTRVVGVLAADKAELKKLINSCEDLSSRMHQHWLIDNCFFQFLDGQWMWLPKANAIRRAISDAWEKGCFGRQIETMMTPTSYAIARQHDVDRELKATHLAYWEQSGAVMGVGVGEIAVIGGDFPLKKGVHAEDLSRIQNKNGLLESSIYLGDRIHLFVENEKLFTTSISSLQFIMEMPKILGFEFRIILCTGSGGAQKTSRGAKIFRLLQEVLEKVEVPYGIIRDPQFAMESRIQVQMTDVLGRWWDGPFLAIDPALQLGTRVSCVEQSAWGSLERVIALYVETHKGVTGLLEKIQRLKWALN